MTKPLTISELKKELKIMNEFELKELILELYKSSVQVKEILNAKFIGDSYLIEILETYKRKMLDEFYPKGNRAPSLKGAKLLITDFKKFGDLASILDLMLYYVELGTRYTDEYGDINQAFYDSLCRVYEEFIHELGSKGTEELYYKFKSRVEKLVSMACNMAWGYGEFIMEKTREIIWDENDLEWEE